MKILEHIPLASLTSLHCGGTASYVIECGSIEDVVQAIAFTRKRNLLWYVLGEGTNVLAQEKGFFGVIIRVCVTGISYQEQGTSVHVTAGAGESWDAFVHAVAKKELWGIENLAGIPGTVGAAPVQNIGAYGMELADSFVSAHVLNTQTNTIEQIEKDACAFGYRDSIFKQSPHLIILSVTLALSRDGTPHLAYKDLARVQDEGASLSRPQEIGDAVRDIRSRKFPDMRLCGTAGSFFKNPIISTAAYETLVQTYGPIPSFPHPNGIKIPLAFVLDTILHLKGYRQGNAWLFDAQPLVLVLDNGGTSIEVETLARFVEEQVKTKTNISIEREVRTL